MAKWSGPYKAAVNMNIADYVLNTAAEEIRGSTFGVGWPELGTSEGDVKIAWSRNGKKVYLPSNLESFAD